MNKETTKATVRAYALEGISREYLDFAIVNKPEVIDKTTSELIAPLNYKTSESYEETLKIMENLKKELDETAENLIYNNKGPIAHSYGSKFKNAVRCLEYLINEKEHGKEVSIEAQENLIKKENESDEEFSQRLIANILGDDMER